MIFSNRRLSQNLEDDREILMWMRHETGVRSRSRHAHESIGFSPHCRELASVASRCVSCRTENRFLSNYRDPFSNRAPSARSVRAECASVVRRALDERSSSASRHAAGRGMAKRITDREQCQRPHGRRRFRQKTE
jgi:hypothetical protein